MERESEPARTAPRWLRLGWFGAIWTGSVIALAVVAWLIKWAVKAPM